MNRNKIFIVASVLIGLFILLILFSWSVFTPSHSENTHTFVSSDDFSTDYYPAYSLRVKNFGSISEYGIWVGHASPDVKHSFLSYLGEEAKSIQAASRVSMSTSIDYHKASINRQSVYSPHKSILGLPTSSVSSSIAQDASVVVSSGVMQRASDPGGDPGGAPIPVGGGFYLLLFGAVNYIIVSYYNRKKF